MSEVKTIVEFKEIEKSTYLDRFTQAGLIEDRKNIEEITEKFLNTLHNQSRKGTLHAVGGTITKRLPRPDIDIVMTLDVRNGDPIRAGHEDILSFELRQFELFKSIVNEMLKNTRFKKIKSILPSLDDNYGHLGMMKNNGIIEISTETIPVQIIINPTGKSPISNPKSPAILLTKAE